MMKSIISICEKLYCLS